jgi:hypothetical protein
VSPSANPLPATLSIASWIVFCRICDKKLGKSGDEFAANFSGHFEPFLQISANRSLEFEASHLDGRARAEVFLFGFAVDHTAGVKQAVDERFPVAARATDYTQQEYDPTSEFLVHPRSS